MLGLERLHWSGKADVTEDIAGAIGRLTRQGARRDAHKWWAYRTRVALTRAVRALQPDLIHSGHPNATPLGKLACPRVVTCHDLIPLRFPEQYLDLGDGYRVGRERLDRRRYHSADHVIAVSQTTADDLVNLLQLPPERITVVHNGVDLSRWSPEPAQNDPGVRARYKLDDRNYVLYVGGADWRKNANGMLEGLARARQQAPELDVVLAWAARLDGDERREVQRTARLLGVKDALLLLGYVPDDELGALYRGAAAQLFVSRAEGFGYPVVEAMAAGCPVITSNVSSTAEVAGDAALLVAPEDPEAIARAIIELSGSPSMRRVLSRRGTAQASRFSLERMAEGTLRLSTVSNPRRLVDSRRVNRFGRFVQSRRESSSIHGGGRWQFHCPGDGRHAVRSHSSATAQELCRPGNGANHRSVYVGTHTSPPPKGPDP